MKWKNSKKNILISLSIFEKLSGLEYYASIYCELIIFHIAECFFYI